MPELRRELGERARRGGRRRAGRSAAAATAAAPACRRAAAARSARAAARGAVPTSRSRRDVREVAAHLDRERRTPRASRAAQRATAPARAGGRRSRSARPCRIARRRREPPRGAGGPADRRRRRASARSSSPSSRSGLFRQRVSSAATASGYDRRSVSRAVRAGANLSGPAQSSIGRLFGIELADDLRRVPGPVDDDRPRMALDDRDVPAGGRVVLRSMERSARIGADLLGGIERRLHDRRAGRIGNSQTNVTGPSSRHPTATRPTCSFASRSVASCVPTRSGPTSTTVPPRRGEKHPRAPPPMQSRHTPVTLLLR